MRKIVGTLAALLLAAALFPTLRAIVNGSSSQPTLSTAPVASAVGPLILASQADQNAPRGAVRILIVGNSVAKLLAKAFDAIDANPPLAMLDEAIDGCGFPPELTDVRIKLPDGLYIPQPPCDPAWEPSVIARFRPTIVFWIVSDPLGTGGTYRGQHLRPCSAAYESLYTARLKQEIMTLGARGAKVVIPTEAYSRFLGTALRDDVIDCQNKSRRDAVASTNAQLVDLFGYICPHGHCRVRQDGVLLRPDGLHYDGPGGVIVAQWLLDQVR